MTTEEMDRAIAEHLGWRCVDVYEWDQSTFPATRRPKQFHIQDNGMAVNLPRYSTDLNAMHEAEKVILQNADTGYDYDCNMNMVCETWEDGVMNYMKLWHATATQRAEAFLRTIGKWRDA